MYIYTAFRLCTCKEPLGATFANTALCTCTSNIHYHEAPGHHIGQDYEHVCLQTSDADRSCERNYYAHVRACSHATTAQVPLCVLAQNMTTAASVKAPSNGA